MKYFNNVETLEELRRQYKELLKKFHPDNANGSTEATQEINAEYDKLFKVLKDKHESKTADSKQDSYDNMKYDFSEDKALREILQKIIRFQDVMIEVCGNWVWLSGETYQYKDSLKEIGFKWASKKRQWYWHGEAFRKRSKKALSMDDIRNYYGSTEVKTEERKQLKQA